MNVLIVEDDFGVARFLKQAISEAGYNPVMTADGQSALEQARVNAFSLILLDIMIPQINGLEVCRQLRRENIQTPVLMITARDGLEDKVEGLDAGADDYLVKPFSPGELAARARSVLRRCGDYGGSPTDRFVPQGVGVEVDVGAREVWVDGEPVALAAKEFELLAYFVDHPRRACTRDELLTAVWSSGEGWQTPATVTEHVYRLRQKVEHDPGRPNRLTTVRAVGYRWEG